MGKNAEVGHVYNKEIQKIQNKTGYNGDQDILKNIYDLEGNNYEWTSQANYTGGRVTRGSFHINANSGNFYPASNRNIYNSTYANRIFSSRSTLYL